MDVSRPLALLGGLSPEQFMRRHWQRKPLLVRQAWPGVRSPLERAALFAVAAQDGVESRLLSRFDGRWRLRHGPFSRRQLPAKARADWTLLVQGLDLHDDAARAMLSAFRFVADARLDDLMLSWASDGGGVGPHRDSYDVFLLQVQGRRRWRIGPVADAGLVPGLPVRILANFEPDQEWLLEPGDMLYLPPSWGHDGVAEGECMTCSIGFRAAEARTLAQELLHQIAAELDPDHDVPDARPRLYRDAGQTATARPGELPAGLRDFAQTALRRALDDPRAIDRALGCLMTEPKPRVWFDAGCAPEPGSALRLDRRSRMAYDARHVFINGEAFVAGGRDAALMRQLADERSLPAGALRRLGAGARALVEQWCLSGWLRCEAGQSGAVP